MSARATVARLGSTAAIAATAHTALNLRLLRRPDRCEGAGEPVSVLLPVRNEATRIRPCLQALARAADEYGNAEIVVLDDQSSDATASVAREVLGDRARIVAGAAPPPGWLGKPHACQQAADVADPRSSVLVFLDADVVLSPDALSRTVALLRSTDLQLVSPYPRQRAEGTAERLVQPLLQWSWLTFLPLRLAEQTGSPALAAANGQLLAVDRRAYRRTGGHHAVRGDVLDDIALLRSFKRHGLRGAVADGTGIATCRMYDGWRQLRSGYRKSLWSAFGSPAGAVAAHTLLATLYLVPPWAWCRNPRDRWAALGTVAGIAGRALVARRVGGRVWPDSAAHPLSVALFTGLTADSWIGHRRGTLRWAGRPL